MPRIAEPRQKLQLFCKAMAEAAACVVRYHQDEAATLGADDLLPVMAYVLLQAGMSDLASQVWAWQRTGKGLPQRK